MRCRKSGCRLLLAALGLSLAARAGAHTGRYMPGAGIEASPHDFGGARNGMSDVAPPANPQRDNCIFCHASQTAYTSTDSSGNRGGGAGAGGRPSDGFAYPPLWDLEIAPDAAKYTTYEAGHGGPLAGARASRTPFAEPGSVSLLCLSCHDGSIGANAHGSGLPDAASGGVTLSARHVIGKDGCLGNHHPIGIDYDLAGVKNMTMRPADIATLGRAGTVRDHLYGPSHTRVECGTCHSVHNIGNTGESLLWRSDRNSRLCLTCHDKGWDPGTATP